MNLPSIADVLRLPIVKAARPTVAAAAENLDREIRWLHVAEFADIAELLHGGELVLTTGVALPEADSALETYVRSLAGVGAAGLMIELGRRWDEHLPAALIQACDDVALPLIALEHETRFVTVTQAVSEMIVGAQVAELRAAEQVHEMFTRLTADAASPRDIIDAVHEVSGLPAVLESASHRPVEFNSGAIPAAALLTDWELKSRRLDVRESAGYDDSVGWLVARVETRGRVSGRVVLVCGETPAKRHLVLVERAAAALALHQLHSRDRANQVRRTHHELVLGLLEPTLPPGIIQRCELVGFPMRRRRFVALSARVRPGTSPAEPTTSDVVSWCVRTAAELKLPVLVCPLEDDLRIVFSLPEGEQIDRAVDGFADRLSHVVATWFGAGCVVDEPAGIGQSLREAQHVLDSIRGTGPVVHRLDDVHVRGLLALLRDDERLTMFAHRELGALAAYDEATGAGVTDAVAALVSSVDKSAAAQRTHLSRPAFYARLARAEQVLGVDLDDPEIRTSLHLAFLSTEFRRP